MKFVLVLFILWAIAMLSFGPIFLIWSLNTLFGLSIAFSFKTWLAGFFLILVIGGYKANIYKKN